MATDPFSSDFSSSFGGGPGVGTLSATQSGQTISALANLVVTGFNPFSSAFSADFGAGNVDVGVLVEAQASQSLVAVAHPIAGLALHVTQAQQSIVAILIVGQTLGTVNVRQAGQTLASAANSPALPVSGHLAVSLSSNILTAVASASTSFHVAGLTVVQSPQIITNPAVAPALSIQSEVGNAILSETGTTLYSELYSSSTVSNPTTTPSAGQTSGTGLGSQSDMLNRLAAVLPTGWFPDSDTPVVDGILSGIANIWSTIWTTLAYVAGQTRISTATDINLDIISSDFLGTSLPRGKGELDASFRSRILAAIFQKMATRSAISSALLGLTGTAPKIFEPTNANDTGGWGSAVSALNTGLAYGFAGGYGSYDIPFQAFIQTASSTSTTVASIQGYGSATVLPAGYQVVGGYGAGALEYILGTEYILSASDQDVYDVINRIKPVATIIWVSTNYTPPTNPTNPGAPSGSSTPALDSTFILDVSRLAAGDVAPTAYLSRSQLSQTIAAAASTSALPPDTGQFTVTQGSQSLSSSAFKGALVVSTLALGQSVQTISATAST